MDKSSRRYSHFILAGIALILTALLFPIERDQAPVLQSDAKKIFYTPEELKQAEIQKKKERRKNGYTKFDGPDKYAQYHHAIRTKAGESEPGYTFNYRLEELEKAFKNPLLHKKRVSAMDWVERGPANVSGRTRTLINLDETTDNVWLAGSVSGGVWKTTDGGLSWQLLTPDLPNLATSTLGLSPANPDIIYAGTGEGFFNVDAVNGDGIFKSIDEGVSWTQLSSTVDNEDFQNVNRIIVDPADPDILLVCANNGRYSASHSAIMRSIDGGETWTKVYETPRKVQQLIYSPGNFNVQYATVNGTGVFKSTDAGFTWTSSSEGMTPTGRIEIAISPTDPQYIYASAEGNLSSAGSDLYLSVDGGDEWRLVVETDNGKNYNWLGSQGWYDNAAAVHPFNKNVVYVGGINLWKMEILNPSGDPSYQPADAETENTESFLDFVNFGGLFLNGGVTTGPDWYDDYPEYPVNLGSDEYVSVEIRFGSGLSQKAHRFVVPAGEGASVPPTDYTYADYVTVPFQVWDVTNDVQLMVSFRDQEQDGAFDLEPQDPEDPAKSREYLFVNAVSYNPLSPDPNIAQTAGMAYKNMYAMWPTLPDGASWTPGSLPESKVIINTVERVMRETTVISDAYHEMSGKNSNVHVDHHVILPIVTNQAGQTFKLLNANDGGVYVSAASTDPGVADGSWSHVSAGYNTTQFYGIDKKRGEDQYLGGMQDNGTWRSDPAVTATASTDYIFQISGDGFDVAWNYADPSKMIGSAQFNSFFRTVNGGETWQEATSGLTDDDDKTAPFISKIENVKTNPDVLFAIGKSGVWRSDNFGGLWTSTPISDSWTFGSFTDVKISLANNQIVWAGGEISLTGRLHASTDGGMSFNKTSNYPEETMGAISGLATHPEQDSTAYALFSFAKSPKILRTTDLGSTWTDITGFEGSDESLNGFPDVAVYSFFVFPNEPNRLWAGTEIGLVESLDNGQSWTMANNGLPNAAIWDIKLVDNQIVVATHGRGVWTVEIPVETSAFFAPYISGSGMTPQGELALAVSLRSDYDSVKILVNNTPTLKKIDIVAKDTVFRLFNLPTNDSVTIAIDAYLDNNTIRSNYAKEFIFDIDEYLTSYTADFDGVDAENDFLGGGFSVKMAQDFTDLALHSDHEYKRNHEYKCILKKPIVISEENASLSYEDIALVEPGDQGNFFGDENFYDYVIVEGTLDGLNWIPLMDGYDAGFNENWRLAYTNKENGREELFVKHSVNLLNVFSPGDTALFRLRLFSDPGEVNWGWAIDNLAIQSGEPLKSVDYLKENFFIHCYPNPVQETATLRYSLPHPSPAKIQVLNIAGQKVEEYSPPLTVLKGKLKWTPPGRGLYIVRIKTTYGERSAKILVKD